MSTRIANASGARGRRALVLLVSCLGLPARADAYPSAVVFAPTGDARGLGDVGLLAYASYVLAKKAGPGAGWFGVEGGVAPKRPYGASGVGFGGAEVGLDLFTSDLAGTPDAFVKPELNAKIAPLTESTWTPGVALGVLGVTPSHRTRSLDLAYGALTKTLGRGTQGATSYGKVTLGLAFALGPHGDEPYRASLPVFVGGWPFAASSKLALLAGWASPAFGRFSVAVDYVGGVSEVSSANLAFAFAPVAGTSWAVGGFVVGSHDRFAAGALTYLTIDWNLSRAPRAEGAPPP